MNTLYSSHHVYLHLSNNDLLQIPYNQTLSSETPISSLTPPPGGSRLVISSPFSAQPVLYAIDGHNLNYYDPIGDVWHQINSNALPWCSDATPFAPPVLQQGILFYGGSCSNNQALYSYNTSTKATQKQDTTVHPLGFADAAYTNIDYATTVFVGGNTSTSVWVGMNQVAYYQGGWNYRNVDNSNMLDSRSGALLLPIYPASYSLDSTSTADRALILGGTVDGRTAEPYSAVLEFGDQGWGYHANASFEVDGNVVGAALLFETLVTIGEGQGQDQSKEADSEGGLQVQEKVKKSALNPLRKRSTYSIQLYNVNNLEPVQKYVPSQAATSTTPVTRASTTVSQASSTSVAATTDTSISSPPSSTTKSHSGMSTGGIAALSTILPLAAIFALLGIWWYRKKKTNEVQLPRERLDYFDDFMPRDRDVMSDANSLNSWTEKRRIWESDHNRNSILSNKDLVNNRDSILDPDLPLPSPPRPARKASVKSAFSYDGNVNDVQVLVSSRRRTQLRVVNADEDLIDL
ncbi:hypothetical protein B0I72DRAFT_15722 [Yarrowia lipolytica]|jgi:hypothetical protein|uniref:YALI0D17710p n=2 Tax=Yarrowia lipolytica TaxID=4952 RepID=Q6C8R0_YARLI|nr:YALI0D17710p [Yarrowia lipolytica CLIB122]AOW04206.1 hypothetical protein YALI1_D21667g [Yarrowia lipolytica]KAB8281905.1 hypothetical protein BKA91DRAFT_27040 [Yarrowia lipolytica]KAE8169091.1 hypothetical protein BKA90DRAFT_4751 [Yarrowia lipolytica]KAJ8054264.1 hypothetical protein LXG23DRAFT_48581 [Yarrowia lipolytica]QNP98338.1 Hypothetical protein YALI2_D00779g [Yarrowia lipolytica]|eukprot:XP_502952.1 YALI0D17710p [Yarrowia lipolytica CLIB122]